MGLTLFTRGCKQEFLSLEVENRRVDSIFMIGKVKKSPLLSKGRSGGVDSLHFKKIKKVKKKIINVKTKGVFIWYYLCQNNYLKTDS